MMNILFFMNWKAWGKVKSNKLKGIGFQFIMKHAMRTRIFYLFLAGCLVGKTCLNIRLGYDSGGILVNSFDMKTVPRLCVSLND